MGTLPIDNAVAVRLNPVQKTIGLAWPCIAHTPELGAHIMIEVKSPNIQHPYCMLLHFKWSSSRGRGCIVFVMWCFWGNLFFNFMAVCHTGLFIFYGCENMNMVQFIRSSKNMFFLR